MKAWALSEEEREILLHGCEALLLEQSPIRGTPIRLYRVVVHDRLRLGETLILLA